MINAPIPQWAMVIAGLSTTILFAWIAGESIDEGRKMDAIAMLMVSLMVFMATVVIAATIGG